MQNGVLDLTTGGIRDGRPDDRITIHSPVTYDPFATCPRFQQFLQEIFEEDADLISFVHRAVGYSLTGRTIEQVVFIAFGNGANGKGRLFSALRSAIGPLGWNMPFSTFELKGRSSVPNDLAALVGRRFVTASETNEGTRLNEARVKALTGEDDITARFLSKELFEFRPVAKFWLAVNHKPRVSDDSYGFWRRVRLIPFNRQFGPDEADPDLEKKLLAERAGILAWMVQGALEWQKHGLNAPESVMAATAEYKEESDPLLDFISVRCDVGPEKSVSGSDLYRSYQDWAEQERLRVSETFNKTIFGIRMGQKFRKKRKNKSMIYFGIQLGEQLQE